MDVTLPADPLGKLPRQVSEDVAAARSSQFLGEGVPSLFRQGGGDGRIALPVEAQAVRVNDEINILGKPFDKPKSFRQGCPTLKAQLRVPVGQPVVERIENETDPKVPSLRRSVTYRAFGPPHRIRPACLALRRARKASKALLMRQQPDRP